MNLLLPVNMFCYIVFSLSPNNFSIICTLAGMFLWDQENIFVTQKENSLFLVSLNATKYEHPQQLL